MSTFTAKLEYKLSSSGLAIITKPVSFYMNDTLDGEYIMLVPGMITNFATIPNWLQHIFPATHEDYKMAAAFHDGLVCEFGDQIYIMHSGAIVRDPSWQESAMWFREMMCVRQAARRRKRAAPKQFTGVVIDFITRWSFWSAVSVHGKLK